MNRHLQIIGVSILAGSVFWLMPKLWRGPETLATQMKQNDQFVLPWLKGYLSSCELVNGQYDQMYRPDFAKNFCECLADRYMTAMSEAELLAVAKGGPLPSTLLADRSEIQDGCISKALDAT